MNRNAFEHFVKINLNNRNLNNLSYIKRLINDDNILYRLYYNLSIKKIIMGSDLDALKFKYKYMKNMKNNQSYDDSDDEDEDENGANTSIFYESKDNEKYINIACIYGSLKIVKWFNGFEKKLNMNFKKNSCRTLSLIAAYEGHLNILKWISKMGTNDTLCVNTYFDSKIMDEAANNGKLHVCKWLYKIDTERKIGYSTIAMDLAARGGHLDVCKWLHKIDKERKVGCTTQAMDWAANCCHLDVVKWLGENRKEGCSRDVLYMDHGRGSVKNIENRFEIIKYIDNKYGLKNISANEYIQNAAEIALRYKWYRISIYLIEYLCKNKKICVKEI